jgi:hypothetical protein
MTNQSPLYLGIPASRKRDNPLTLLPKLAHGDCSQCGVPLVWHAPTYKRAKCAFARLGWPIQAVCPDCAETVIAAAPMALVLNPSDPEAERACRTG